MSFNIALTGLNAVSEQLNTVSNNIANSSTTGFKSSRTEFGSVYADTQAMGVEVLGNTQSISLGGALINTSRTLDLAISGGGFFIVKGTNGETQYTRAGVFGTDSANFIVNKAGQKLQGYPTDADGNLMTGSLGDLRIKAATLPASATTGLEFVANLDANMKQPVDGAGVPIPFDPTNVNSYNSTYTTKVYDSLGKEHTLTQYFVTDGANGWDAYYYVDGAAAGTQALSFDTNGMLNGATGASVVVPGAVLPGASAQTIAIDYTGTTQYGTNFGVSTNLANGYTSGEQTGIGIDSKGNVFVNYSNGQSQLQGQVVLASFINPEGLKNVSGTAWTATTDSGDALTGAPGVAQFGTVNAGTLENSNVDLTEELVSLMQGQRNYQANTKVISTQKDLDQILFSAM
ncbi:flagellar basal body FlaE domain-containing protein [Pseudomonas flexibilis]|uniref:Flagellar hook protein FlgE n=1 Tax=Pseudomonas flexibilis TaxID=706570 RepID=A0A1N6Q0H5_9PSED|nr:flagellar hook protein FlgE [Pseudomonas flexibilis]KHL69335.1 flagellar basal body FlaE domain-containing protein [Pseudomonas flexibilis]SIQ10080.1 flagellar hook protein FlgE [Pseudomonas flexibilis]